MPPVARIGRCTYFSAGDVTANRLAANKKRLEKLAKSGAGQDAILRAERTRLMNLQAEGQRLKNARLREELAPVDVIRWTISEAGRKVALVLGGIPASIKKKCPRLTASGTQVVHREIAKAQALAVGAGVPLNLEEFERNQ